MQYDLKTSSNEILTWAMDVILMRKSQYMAFLERVESGEELPEMKFIHETIWWKDGVTLKDFDDEIELIQNELDKDYRYR